MPSSTRPAPPLPRLTAPAALLVALLCASPEAGAATTIGSDLSGAPTSACTSPAGCTATTLSNGGGRQITAPFGGVIVRLRIKHGPAPPAARYTLKVLSGSGSISNGLASFALERQTGSFQFQNFVGGGTDVVAVVDAAGRPHGIPISPGQRIGVFVPGGVGFQAHTPGHVVAERDGDHASGTAGYTLHSGFEALINADLEPDGDADGYGDQSQDNCPSVANDQSSNPCPAPLRPLVPPPIVTSGAPAGYRKPRIGRLVRIRRPLSSLSRKGLSVAVRCHGACIARGALVVGKSVSVGRGRRRTTSGGGFRLELKLTRKGKRVLRRLRRDVRLTLRVTASDRWGESSRRQRLIVTR